jgi:2-keto-3-deoxy-6-phosphogluconate aldolase
VETAADYLAAGAAAVAVGGSICNDRILREEGPEGVIVRAATLMERLSSLSKAAAHGI